MGKLGTIVLETVKKYGHIDILVNNAGIGAKTENVYMNDKFDRHEWDLVFDTNFYGQVYGMMAVVPEMKKVGGGSIINCASLSAICAMGGCCAYLFTR